MEDLLRTGRTIVAIVSDYKKAYETERCTWVESNYSWLPSGLHIHPDDPEHSFMEKIESPKKPTIVSNSEAIKNYFNNVQHPEFLFRPEEAGIQNYEVFAEDGNGNPVAISFQSWELEGGETKEYEGKIILLPQPTNLRFDAAEWFQSLIEIGYRDSEDELQYEETENRPKSSTGDLINICKRFPLVARQLEERYDDRDTIEITDEYDVQDLFHALLRLYFDDVRSEEYSPSHAGSSGRVDFLIKNKRVAIEIKYATKSRKNRVIKKEISEDKEHYRAHPDCETLICYIYDPKFHIENPDGFEKYLSNSSEELSTEVFVSSSSN